MTTEIKSYKELISLPTFEERFNYCKTEDGKVGEVTFGAKRYLNQILYHSGAWKRLRNEIIIRDNGCDLAHPDFPIGIPYANQSEPIYIHHLNALTSDDILNHTSKVFDLDNLVCVSFDTHNAIHYSGISTEKKMIIREPNDTCPWRR